jgi:succinate dehydrogenase / fumarate reductase membrane anchor subunit
MRLSGVALLLLALGHLFLMHVFNSVHEIDYDFVAGRYARWFWRGYDLLLLWLALLHGLNGARVLLEDHLRPPVRALAVKTLAAVGVAFLALGTWVIVRFQP